MMHNKFLGQILALAFLSLGLSAVIACSDDDPSNTDALGGSAGASNDGTEGASDSGAAGRPQSPTPTGGDKCTNRSDLAAVQETYTSEKKTVPQVTSACAVSCVSVLDEQKKQTCVTDCVLAKTENALSEDCAGCYTKSALCAGQNCLAQCITDPASKACTTCRCGENANKINCVDDVFVTCSGIPSDTCK